MLCGRLRGSDVVPDLTPQDSFEGTAGVTLNGRTATSLLSPYGALTGQTWTRHAVETQDVQLDGTGGIRCTGTTAGGTYLIGTPPHRDYTARCRIKRLSDLGVNVPDLAGLVVRYDPTALTGYQAYMTGGEGTLALWRSIAGTSVTLFSTTFGRLTDFPVGETAMLELSVCGPAVSQATVSLRFVTPRRTFEFSYIDATPVTGTGQAGVKMWGSQTASTGCHIVDFWASSPWAAPTGTDLVVGFVGDSITQGFMLPAGLSLAEEVCGRLRVAGGVTREVAWVDLGIGGSKSTDWASDQSAYTTAAAVFASTGAQWTSVMLGVNDAHTSVQTSLSAYRAALASLCAAEIAAGRKVVLHYPTYRHDGAGNLTLLAGYCGQIDSLVNGTTIFQGDTLGFAITRDNPGLFVDGVHLNGAGQRLLAELHAAAIYRAESPASSSGGLIRSRVVNAGG
jgi:lysophospholipase L1-like esterase